METPCLSLDALYTDFPVYGAAYAYGATEDSTGYEGVKARHICQRKPKEQWLALITGPLRATSAGKSLNVSNISFSRTTRRTPTWRRQELERANSRRTHRSAGAGRLMSLPARKVISRLLLAFCECHLKWPFAYKFILIPLENPNFLPIKD